ncbi:MAG: DUF3592 domain-containing protein [Acidimicrobiia bacterium]|nr:DUF3592 domain-containing protein [Acidimicrobiia bacterium]
MKRGGCLKVAVLVIVVPIVFGLGLLLVSNLNRVLNHETAPGVIVDLVFTTDSDGDPAYTPVYEYAVDGNTYLYEGAISYSGAIVPSIGDRVTILYDPGNPADARVRNLFLLVWLPILLICLPILIAAGIFWSIRRRRRMAGSQEPPWAGEQPGATQSDPVDGRELITADFMGTEPSPMDDQGRVRYRVKARAEIDDTIRRFVSDWMDEDPTLYYMQHGNKVDVWVDPNDPNFYEVTLPQE